jgi:hypothetical protein
MIKRMSILTRREDVSFAQFREHWFGIHAEMLKRLMPEVRGYIQNLWLGPGPNPLRPPGPHRIDGIVELWFDDEAAVDGFVEISWASAADMAADMNGPTIGAMRAEADRFIAAISGSVIEERVVVGPTGGG